MKSFYLTLLSVYVASNSYSQAAAFEQNLYAADNSQVSQIISFGDSLLVKSESYDAGSSFTQLRMIDTEGNSLWAAPQTLYSVGPIAVSSFSDTSFFHLQIEDWCDVMSGMLTFNEYDLDGNIIWQTTYDMSGQTNPNAPAYPNYFDFIALNETQLVLLENYGAYFFDRDENDFTQSVSFPFENWVDVLRKDDEAFIAYSPNGIFEITASGITQLNDVYINHLHSFNDQYMGIAESNSLLAMSDELQVTDTVDLAGLEVLNWVNDIEVSDEQIYFIVVDAANAEHLIALNDDFEMTQNWTLPEGQNYNVREFEIQNGHLILGGSNENYTLDNSRNLVKSIPIESTANLFDEDIQVSGFELTDYHFSIVSGCPQPCYSFYFMGDVTVTNNSSNPVNSFSIHYQPIAMVPTLCGGLFYTQEIGLTIQPNGTITFPIDNNMYYSDMWGNDYGQMVDLNICFSTMGPNDHMDDVPENDEHCSEHEVLFIGVAEAGLTTVAVYPNPVEELLNVQLPQGTHHLQLFDMAGHVVADYGKHRHSAQLRRESIAAGVYMLSVSNDERATSVHKVVFR